MTHTQVLVVGDLLLDRRIEGEMTRISPEAPAPVLKLRSASASAGGAGLVATSLAALGHPCVLVGVSGQDPAGHELRNILRNTQGIHYEGDAVGTKTIVKHRLTAGGQQVFRIDEDGPLEPDHEHLWELIKLALTAKGRESLRLVVISDYGKGTLDLRTIERLLAACKERRLPVFLDCKPSQFSCYEHKGVTLIKANHREAMEIANSCTHPAYLFTTGSDAFWAAAQWIQRQLPATAVVITAGADGAYVRWQDNQYPEASKVHYPAVIPRPVFDVCGAGDAFMAALVASWLERVACDYNFANLVAGIAVSRHGTTPVTRDEVNEELHRMGGIETKLMTAPVAAEFIARRQRLKQRVVFTNGCFDLLHPGHTALLETARSLGGCLVVAYNSDASVTRLKGAGRPVIPESMRARHLALLSCVDAVVRFDEDTPDNLLRLLKPDLLIKGNEYAGQVIAGADVVASYGGETQLVEMLPGYSTSNLVGRIS